METTQRKVVRVHRQAMDMFEVVRRHLERFPQDGALFVLDFERALGDLGFDLSRGMREHLLQRLYPPVPDGGELYDAVKQGQVALPAQIRVNFGSAAPVGADLPGVRPVASEIPITRAATKALEKSEANARDVPPKPGTGGYSVLVQLTDDIVNRIISVAYDANLFPHQWSGSYQMNWRDLRVEIDANYDVSVEKPTIDFNTIYVNGVALNLKASAKLKLTFSYLDFPSGILPTVSDTLEASVTVAARAVGTAEIRNTNQDKSAVYLNLLALHLINVDISGPSLPPLVKELLQATIQRIAQTEVGKTATPLSFDFEALKRAGVPIRPASRIRQPGGGSPGTLTIAIDTEPFSGDPSTIPHIIPAGNGFGFVTSRHFLLDQAWPIVRNLEFPGGCKSFDQGITICNPQLDLRNNYMYFYVRATKEIDCLPDVHADVTVDLQFKSLAKDANGVYHTRLEVINKDDMIHVDFWDRLFYTLLGGLLLAGVGGVVGAAAFGGVIGMIVVNVLIAILEGKGDTALTGVIQASSVGFRDKIPGTKIVVEASTPIAPTIYDSLIFGYGDAVSYPES